MRETLFARSGPSTELFETCFRCVTRSRPFTNVLHHDPRQTLWQIVGMWLPTLTNAQTRFLGFRVSASAGGNKLIGGGEHFVDHFEDPLKARDAK